MDFSAVGKPCSTHMLYGVTPWVCSSDGSNAIAEAGRLAPGAGSPVPFGQACPVVSMK